MPQKLNLPSNLKDRLVLLAILLVTLFSYSPCLHNGFNETLDDQVHLTKNPSIQQIDFAHLKKIFTSTIDDVVYVPLTILSFAIEYFFFGLNPFIYHLINILLHMGSVALILQLVLRSGFSLRTATLTALLFAIHPIHVESVAWITERKDVLYAFFYLLAIIQYQAYSQKGKSLNYILSLIFGLLSILAKPMALSLPLVLWLCDWLWKRPRTMGLVFEKIPYFLYMIPIAWITYSLHARVTVQNLGEGILIWTWCFSFYLLKFLWPLNLLVLYQLPSPVSPSNPHFGIAIGIFAGVVLSLIIFRRNRLWIFALLFYFVSIFFLLRYDDLKDTNIVANRFMYLPCFGFCLWAGFYGDRLLDWAKGCGKIVFSAMGIGFCIVTLFFVYKDQKECRIFGDEFRLWNRVLEQFPAELAYYELGNLYLKQEDYEKALTNYTQSLSMTLQHPDAFCNRGIIYAMNKDYERAISNFNQSIQINPDVANVYYNRGLAFWKNGQHQKAIDDFTTCLGKDPLYVLAYQARAEIYYYLKEYTLAKKDFQQAYFLTYQKLPPQMQKTIPGSENIP